MKKIYYHLPGLFSFYSFYKKFLPLFYEHRNYFYDWCEIGSIYGAPRGCIWNGGRISDGEASIEDVVSLMNQYRISSRLTFSNSLLEDKHLMDPCGNACCQIMQNQPIQNGVIIHSERLLQHIKNVYPNLYFVSSTTKVLTDFMDFYKEIQRNEFRFVVPDFRLNKQLDCLNHLSQEDKAKVEFLCNECCWIGCKDRKRCYEAVSQLNLNGEGNEYLCKAPDLKDGYRFSKAMENPCFISVQDIINVYSPMGFEHFKIEGRGLGTALVLEFLLYYMVRPEYQLHVREYMYLENMLDLF